MPLLNEDIISRTISHVIHALVQLGADAYALDKSEVYVRASMGADM